MPSRVMAKSGSSSSADGPSQRRNRIALRPLLVMVRVTATGSAEPKVVRVALSVAEIPALSL